MRYLRPVFLKQKPILYFDENFPAEIVEELRQNRSFVRSFKTHSVSDFGNEKKPDSFQFEFCRKKRFVLVTLDAGFMDDRKYPINNMPGIICVVARRNEARQIKARLKVITDFLSSFPRPKAFAADSKFQVSGTGCIMRGKDSVTREIRTVPIRPGHTVRQIGTAFHYFGP